MFYKIDEEQLLTFKLSKLEKKQEKLIRLFRKTGKVSNLIDVIYFIASKKQKIITAIKTTLFFSFLLFALGIAGSIDFENEKIIEHQKKINSNRVN